MAFSSEVYNGSREENASKISGEDCGLFRQVCGVVRGKGRKPTRAGRPAYPVRGAAAEAALADAWGWPSRHRRSSHREPSACSRLSGWRELASKRWQYSSLDFPETVACDAAAAAAKIP